MISRSGGFCSCPSDLLGRTRRIPLRLRWGLALLCRTFWSTHSLSFFKKNIIVKKSLAPPPLSNMMDRPLKISTGESVFNEAPLSSPALN